MADFCCPLRRWGPPWHGALYALSGALVYSACTIAWLQDLVVRLAALCCSLTLVALASAHWRHWVATACWSFWPSSLTCYLASRWGSRSFYATVVPLLGLPHHLPRHNLLALSAAQIFGAVFDGLANLVVSGGICLPRHAFRSRRGLATGCMPPAFYKAPPGLLFPSSVARRFCGLGVGGAEEVNGGCGEVALWKAGARACRRWAPP